MLPDRGQLGQRRTNGGGADARFRQIDPDACNQVGAPVMPVNRAVHIDHHTSLAMTGLAASTRMRLPSSVRRWSAFDIATAAKTVSF